MRPVDLQPDRGRAAVPGLRDGDGVVERERELLRVSGRYLRERSCSVDPKGDRG